MFQRVSGDDPEPSERVPAGRLLVPVRSGPAGDVIRFFRSPQGGRTAVAFSSRRQLAAVLGPEHCFLELSESALRALARALGVAELTVDPVLIAGHLPTADLPSALVTALPGRAGAARTADSFESADWSRWAQTGSGGRAHLVVRTAGSVSARLRRRRLLSVKR
jgi:hypothetical protein